LNSGKQVSAFSGTLTEQNPYSETFRVVLRGTSQDDCYSCPFVVDTQGNWLSRDLVDYSELPKKCDCVENTKYKNWFCNRRIFSLLCSDNEENWTEQYKLFALLRDMEPERESVVAAAHLVLGALLHGREGTSEYDIAIQTIQSSSSSSGILCAKYQVLNSFCLYAWSQEAGAWISMVNSIYKVSSLSASLAMKGTSRAAQDLVLMKLKSDVKFYKSIDNVWTLATQLQIIPTLAKGFALKIVLECF
jgi:hypothetical protein